MSQLAQQVLYVLLPVGILPSPATQYVCAASLPLSDSHRASCRPIPAVKLPAQGAEQVQPAVCAHGGAPHWQADECH